VVIQVCTLKDLMEQFADDLAMAGIEQLFDNNYVIDGIE
jgi:hypothetical protein